MKVGDIILNPYVRDSFDGKPNPMKRTMVVHIGREISLGLRYDGEIARWNTRKAETWEVADHVDIQTAILGKTP